MPDKDRRSEKEKMLAGQLYRAIGPDLAADNLRADRLLRTYNTAGVEDAGKRSDVLRELLGYPGEEVMVRPPFYCDYGSNILAGSRTFLNFNCVLLDVPRIDIGEASNSAPGCRSSPPTTPAIQNCAGRVMKVVGRYESAATSGSAAVPSSYLA